MTQQNIADILHVGQRTYSDYESGKVRIPVDSLLILAKFYDVSMDYITGASNIKKVFRKNRQRRFVRKMPLSVFV
ncbi:MAG: helix-turn-helix domain-containing protein [Clostridiales bacterium]|nr:helix-turn-helix domain-containing protein [Clostridiales bacterium]